MALKRFTPPAPGSSRKRFGRTQSLLYVEDEDTNWEVAELALRDEFALERARSAEEAFQRLGKKKYDLILMDIQLSGSSLSGIEVTQILKGRYKGDVPAYAEGVRCEQTPIIFVTAYTARYDKKHLVEQGGDDLIAKPVDFVRLSLAISRLLVRGALPTS